MGAAPEFFGPVWFSAFYLILPDSTSTLHVLGRRVGALLLGRIVSTATGHGDARMQAIDTRFAL